MNSGPYLTRPGPLPVSVELQIRSHLDAILALIGPRCRRCHHSIRAAESVRLGIGPKCRKQVA